MTCQWRPEPVNGPLVISSGVLMRMHFLTSSSEKTGAGDFVGNETFVGSDATVIIMDMKDTERRAADMTESTAGGRVRVVVGQFLGKSEITSLQ